MTHQFMKNTMAVQWDRHMGHALLLFLCIGFFTILWGLRLPALTAGAALYGIAFTLHRKGAHERRAKKERLFLDGVKGAMMLEKLLLLPEQEAQHRAASLYLGTPLSDTAASDDHCLFTKDGKKALICYAPLHPEDMLTGASVAHVQRSIIAAGAAEGVILCPGAVSPQAMQQASLHPRVTILFAEGLKNRLGKHAPIPDAQALQYAHRMALGAQRPLLFHSMWTDKNALRLARYAALMGALLLFTGSIPYAFSACAVMGVSAFVHIMANKKRPLHRGR